MNLLIDIAIGFYFLFILACVFTVIGHIWVKVPFVPTPMKIVREMIRVAKLQPGETVCDIGAGDGRFLIEAKRTCPGIRAVGYELAPMIFLLGLLRIWLSRQKVEFHWKDARRVDLSGTDCVFMYLFPTVMEELEKKFTKELSGARVISYSFRFPTKEPTEIVYLDWYKKGRKIFVYQF